MYEKISMGLGFLLVVIGAAPFWVSLYETSLTLRGRIKLFLFGSLLIVIGFILFHG